MKYIPHKYQAIAYRKAYNNPKFMHLLDMGLGKTVVTLTLIADLLNEFEIFKPLIVAPKFVAENTWPAELAKWDHLEGFKLSVITGTEAQRIRALEANVDIWVISRDNILWLVKYLGKKWNFDMLVLDESSNFKNPAAKRFKAVKTILPKLKRLLELTGTPIPNGLMDLWSQMFLIDQGQRLFKFKESFRATYFQPTKALAHGAMQYEINKGAEDLIYEKIKDVCLSMKAVDWLDLPERRDIVRPVELSDYSEYEQFKRDKILELEEGEITAFNASSLYIKLLQYANGAVYDSDSTWHVVHDEKLDALEEAIEELQGQNVIVFYQFKSDIERIKKRLPDCVQLKKAEQINDWNAGKINILLAHPASTAYGLNLQHGGHYIIWFGVPASLELYQQAVARLARQGQKYMVSNIMILVKGTPEYKVYRGLINKTFRQDQLFEALK